MTPATYNYGDQVRGDTIGVRTVTIVIDSSPASLSSARMNIRRNNGALVFNVSPTVNSNVVTIPAIAAADTAKFPVEQLKYDLEVTLSDSTVHTYMGGTINIVTDFSYV